MEEVRLDGAIWLLKSGLLFLDGDRIRLLEEIQALGSITKAAKAIGLSYKSAWTRINTINALADQPLTEVLSRGKGWDGAIVTLHGEMAIRLFRALQEEHRRLLENMRERLDDTRAPGGGSYST